MVVVLSTSQLAEMTAHCLRSLPYEGCGLLVGDPQTSRVDRCVAADNVAQSSRLYTVDPRAMLKAYRSAEEDGLEIIGVFHSHTHTDPYPSPTDVAQAPDPSWHYVIVSLRDEVASIRSYRISGGDVTEEAIPRAREPTALEAPGTNI